MSLIGFQLTSPLTIVSQKHCQGARQGLRITSCNRTLLDLTLDLVSWADSLVILEV